MTDRRTLFAIISAAVLFCLGGPVMAEPKDEKFALVTGQKTDVTFAFSDFNLDMATKSPDKFIWNNSNQYPAGFPEFGMFTDLRERYIGYDPLNRDRFAIAIYTGKLEPQRIALAADYARLFATKWGDTSFGVMPHTPVFGEMLAGDNSSGIMIVTRISVFRRGDEVLVIRSRFQAEHFETYARAMAEFIGNVTFAEPMETDPVDAALQTVSRPIQSDGSVFTYALPPHWEQIKSQVPPSGSGSIDLWVDSSDPNRNLATMVSVIAPPTPLPEAQKAPDPQTMANLSYDLAGSALSTLLPDVTFTLDPLDKTTFGDLDAVALFNAAFVYTAKVGEAETPAQISVLMSMGPNGVLLANTLISSRPTEPYLTGTFMVGNYIQSHQLAAQVAYWTAKAAE